MIFIYDKSVHGCCERSAEVELLIHDIAHGHVPEGRRYRLLNTARFTVPQGRARVVYTNSRKITTAYREAGITVRRIPAHETPAEDEPED